MPVWRDSANRRNRVLEVRTRHAVRRMDQNLRYGQSQTEYGRSDGYIPNDEWDSDLGFHSFHARIPRRYANSTHSEDTSCHGDGRPPILNRAEPYRGVHFGKTTPLFPPT